MAAFSLPSFSTLLAEIKAELRTYRSDAATGPGSDAHILSRTLAHTIHGLHMHLKYGVLENLIPTTARGVYLDAWAYLFGLSDGSGGYGRIKARGSSATDGVTVTATGATVDLQDQEFTDSAGNTYKINESYSFGGAGSHALNVVSVSTGDATNVQVDDAETFTWSSTPANVSETITHTTDFSGAADRETDAELRARVKTHLQQPAQGGNWSQWVDWVEDASPGELRAYVWPQREYTDVANGTGVGTVDYLALKRLESGTDQHILSTDDLYDDIDDQIEEYAPVLLMENSRQLTITATTQLVELDLELATTTTDEDKCDWDAEDIDETVNSSDSGTYSITANGSVTYPTVSNGIEVGDRVIIDEEEVEVATVVNATTFTVTTWPWTGSITSKHIMAGGGLIKTAVDAIRDYCDSLGPAAGTYAAPIPGWDDTMRVAGIKTAVIKACGGKVIDMTMIAPVADVAPGYDDDSDVERIVPSEIVVWEPK